MYEFWLDHNEIYFFDRYPQCKAPLNEFPDLLGIGIHARWKVTWSVTIRDYQIHRNTTDTHSTMCIQTQVSNLLDVIEDLTFTRSSERGGKVTNSASDHNILDTGLTACTTRKHILVKGYCSEVHQASVWYPPNLLPVVQSCHCRYLSLPTLSSHSFSSEKITPVTLFMCAFIRAKKFALMMMPKMDSF